MNNVLQQNSIENGNTQDPLQWFTQNLPSEYLDHPEQYLYTTAVETEQLKNTAENRRRFKALLVERKMEEGMELQELDQEQADGFMRPNDPELKLKRSQALIELTEKYLEENIEFIEASRLAFLELFHKEAPFQTVEMDETYFTNRELVCADLHVFLQKANGDSLLDLTTNNPEYSNSTLTQSGELVTWNTYLKRASGVLLGTKQGGNNPHRRFEALKKLLQIIDVDVPEYVPMDEAYFNNPKYVKADLNFFLQETDNGSLQDLNTNNPKFSTSILTQSGEDVKWNTYLNRASSVLLGTTNREGDCHRQFEALKKLLRIADPALPEYIPMDAVYFNNPKYVQADLNTFLQETDNGSLNDLNGNNPKPSISILTQSGETVKWEAYLNRASGILFGTANKKDNPHRRPEALKKLLRIIGVDVPEYIPMNEAYFANPKYVQADLHAFLQKAKGDSLLDLHTQNPEPSTSILTQSGEMVTWNTYLNRTSGVLFGTKARGDNPHRQPEALKKLLRIIGVDVPEYIPMDAVYFNNPKYVQADLNTFLQETDNGSLNDLHTGNPKKTTSTFTQSGEDVKWNTYLNRASSVLLGTTNREGDCHRQFEALKRLLQIIGVDVPEYIPMDEAYFNNPKYVKADLNFFLQETDNGSLQDLNTNNPKFSTSILTQSGEDVKWPSYLNRASGVLLGTTFKKDNPHRPLEVLKKLIAIVQNTNEQ